MSEETKKKEEDHQDMFYQNRAMRNNTPMRGRVRREKKEKKKDE